MKPYVSLLWKEILSISILGGNNRLAIFDFRYNILHLGYMQYAGATYRL